MIQDKVIGTYCLIDDILKRMGHYENRERKVSDSEVITTAIVPVLYFKGNKSCAIYYMRSHNMIGKSGFTKRLHKLSCLIM